MASQGAAAGGAAPVPYLPPTTGEQAIEMPADADASTRRRPNRTAANRRAQYARAEARVTTHLLRTMDALSGHRGEQTSRMAGALATALRSNAAPPDSGDAGQRNVRARTSLAIEDRTQEGIESPGLPTNAEVEQMMLKHLEETAITTASASTSSTDASEEHAVGPAALPSAEPN